MMTKATCSIEGCEGTAVGRGWCRKHYTRWWNHGDPIFVKPKIIPTTEDRFWSKVNRDGPIPEFAPHLGQCWVWTRALDGKGYGKFTLLVEGVWRFLQAHRVAYELLVGPVPEGLELDHRCRVRNCVRPAHLDPVTHEENQRRGMAGELKTHCIHGHEYTLENTYRPPGKPTSRACRTCMKIRSVTR